MKIAKRLLRVALSLALTAALLLPAAAYEVTDSRYIVESACDFSVDISENRDSVILDKKLFESLLGNLLDKPKYVTIIELPASGTLTHGKDAVVVLDTFKLSGLKTLKFTPDRNKTATICFIASDRAGNTTPLCRIILNPPMTAFAPTAADISLQTGRSMKVAGKFVGEDPSGHELVYELLTAPRKGDLVYNREDASFIYTPHEGKAGSDEFKYTVRNSDGMRTAEATVTIAIDRKDGEVSYTDMGDSLNQYAAQCLAAEGILRGTRVGGQDFFLPDQSIERSEFLVMLMNAAQGDIEIPTIASTGLPEDDAIPVWMKSYVSAAFATGIVSGDPTRGDLLFDAASPITLAEAAVMTANLLGSDGIAPAEYKGVPEWAATGVAVLEQLGIPLRDENGVINAEEPLSRDTAAGLLWRVLNQSRQKGLFN